MIELKVRRIGNSLGIVLPQEVTSELKVDEGDRLFFTSTPGGFRITPYNPEFERQMQAAREVMKENRDALRELAK